MISTLVFCCHDRVELEEFQAESKRATGDYCILAVIKIWISIFFLIRFSWECYQWTGDLFRWNWVQIQPNLNYFQLYLIWISSEFRWSIVHYASFKINCWGLRMLPFDPRFREMPGHSCLRILFSWMAATRYGPLALACHVIDCLYYVKQYTSLSKATSD